MTGPEPAVVALAGVACLAATLYVWWSLALSAVFRKLDAAGWKGWVPIVSDAQLLVLGGYAAWNVVWLFLPIANLYGIVQRIVAVHRIGARFGRGAGTTVLGALLTPVWASILGFGRAAPVGAPSQSASLMARLSLRDAEPPAARPGGGQPVVAEASAGPAVVGPPPTMPPAQNELDETVIVVRKQPPVWELVLDSGERLGWDGTDAVLGRAPIPPNTGTQAVRIPDDTKTVSKTHAKLERIDGEWQITDLDSTNGIVVFSIDGGELLLESGASARVHERFELGRVGITIAGGEGR